MSETPLVLDQIPIRGSVIKSIATRRVPVAGNPVLHERPQMADELLLTAQSDGAEHAQILASEAIDGGFVLRITPPVKRQVLILWATIIFPCLTQHSIHHF